MPCDEWKQLAAKEKADRLESHRAPKITGISQDQRKRIEEDRRASALSARQEMDRHRKSCLICNTEPMENFRDPDPWDNKREA